MFILDDDASKSDANITLPSLDIIFLALIVVEDGLAHSHRLGGNLDELVLLDVFQALLETHHRLRHDTRLIIGT